MKKTVLTIASLSLCTAAGAVTQKGFDAELYGFIKASSMYSTEGLASYNNINLSAPTHAVAHVNKASKTSRMSFQTQQSRIGLNLKKGADLSGKLEFDFIDFNKSSPTTQMNPRVRIASVTYAWGDQKIIIGQDWDLFSPVTSYTFDFVGLYFLAGNTGFMRQQAQYLKTMGNLEIGGALGLAGNNPGIVDSDLELAKSPSYSGRVSYNLGTGRVGLSGIYSRLNYEQSNGSSHDAYGANAFFENTFGENAIKSEAYYGQNLSNLGSLALGKGTATSDVKEFGGNVTIQHKLSEKNVPFGGVGFAKVDNRSQITPIALGTTGAVTSPGISSNFLARVGWEYKVTDDFSWISEVSRYETRSKIADNKYELNVAASLESGVQLKF